MANIFFISDTHFSHENSWKKFKNSDGTPLRPFSSTEEMDETMVENWNNTVKEGDHIYHLGDITIPKRGLEFIKRLNGKKRLIMGNHDILPVQKYLEVGFQKISAYRVFVDKFVCSHMPIHPDSISERFIGNLHGHTHGHRVMWKDGTEIDPRYQSVCVEQINYTPIHFDEVVENFKKQMEDAGYTPPANGWGNGSGPN